jgi:hypothetical protein
MNQTKIEGARALRTTIISMWDIISNSEKLNAELRAQMDDAGCFDEPWWLDYP